MIKYFYCPECGKIYTAKIEYEVQKFDDRIHHDLYCWYECVCGYNAVEIDHGMLLIIQELNKTPFKTSYCCEGHLVNDGGTEDSYSNAYIVFDQSVTMEMFSELIGKYPLPEGWVLEDYNSDNEYNVCIRYTLIDDQYGKLTETEFEIKKKYYLMELSRWVNHVISKDDNV